MAFRVDDGNIPIVRKSLVCGSVRCNSSLFTLVTVGDVVLAFLLLFDDDDDDDEDSIPIC